MYPKPRRQYHHCDFFAIFVSETKKHHNYEHRKSGIRSFKEQLRDAADKGNEMLYKAADAVKDEAKKIAAKVKDYQALSPEEKKAKQDEWNSKLSDAANKASDTAKEVFEDVKESAQKLFKKD